METEKTAILILNWKHSNETVRCLRHLLLESEVVTVVVVDNGSKDNSVEQLQQFLKCQGTQINIPIEVNGASINRFIVNKLDVILLMLPENLGFTGGMNLAAQVALQLGASSLFLLNNDAEIAISDVFKLREISKQNEDALVGPLLCDFYDRETVLFSGRKWPHFLFGLGKQEVARNPREIWQTGYIEGSAMFLPASFLAQKIAKDGFLFDESYFLYCEDVDLSLSAKKLGFNCLVTPRVRVFHKVSLSSGGKGNPSVYYYITRNRILLAKKWLRLGSFSFFILYYMTSRAILVVTRKLLGRELGINKVVLRGLIDGLAGRTGHEK